MQNISEKESKKLLSDLIALFEEHPKVFCRDLHEMEAFIGGYETAIKDVSPDLSDTPLFTYSFMTWLEETKSWGCADGWANGIRRLAEKKNKFPDTLFFKLVKEFQETWIEQDEKS